MSDAWTHVPAAPPAERIEARRSSWPKWVRRHFAIELLGEPSALAARITIALSLLMVVYIGAWNAQHYPITLGYDATAHLDYMRVLVHERHIPNVSETAEGVQPPGYYALAGTAAVLGHKLFGWDDAVPLSTPEPSYRGAQYLNVLFVFLTALCVLWLARVVAPSRPWVHAASVGFFAFLPVVAKTEAMFHPENLNMLASAAAVAAGTHLLAGRGHRKLVAGLMVLALVVGLATRVSTVFTLGVIVVAFLAASLSRRTRRHLSLSRVALLIALVATIGGAAIAVQTVVFHRQPFGTAVNIVDQALHPSTSQGAIYRAPFFHVSYKGPFTAPYRANFNNEAVTQTYTEIWGDWFGAFAWSAYSGQPTPEAQTVLKDQSYIGLAPTFLAVAGWLVVVGAALSRRRALLIMALMPVVVLTGYLYRSYLILTSDGDLFKASYVLTTAPVWAVCFGLAVGGAGRRSRILAAGFAVLFATFAVLELRFMLYGLRDHHPIF